MFATVIAPLVENVATLIDPPGSDRDEATWVAEIVRNSESDLLLDLHNVHANAKNFQEGVVGFFKAIVWPAILVYEVLKLLKVGQSAEQAESEDPII